MSRTSPWPKLLAPLGIALAVVLLAVAAVLAWNGGAAVSEGGGGELGELVAVTQAARSDATAALTGRTDAFDALATSRTVIAEMRQNIAADEAASGDARALAADAALWQRIERGLDDLLGAREPLAALQTARFEVLDIAPQLLAAAGNAASVLSADELTANQPYLARFELTMEALQQHVRALGPG